MSKFNVGDKVRIARPRMDLKEWQDFEAEVLKVDEGDGPYLKPLSKRPWGGFASFWWPVRDLELVAPADTKPDLRAALDTLEEQEGLCVEFDRIVDIMLDDDPLVRLKYAADQEGYEYLFTRLDKILNPPVKPKHVYKEGDWVRITAGEARGSVERVKEVLIEGVVIRETMWYGFHEIEPSAPAVPEKGRWIRATTKDGKTHEFEVTEDNDTGYSTYLAHFPGEGYLLFLNPRNGHEDIPDREVIDWEYIEAPKGPPAVGDVLEAGERPRVSGVYEDEFGRKMYLSKDTSEHINKKRTLTWIDNDSTE